MKHMFTFPSSEMLLKMLAVSVIKLLFKKKKKKKEINTLPDQTGLVYRNMKLTFSLALV